MLTIWWCPCVESSLVFMLTFTKLYQFSQVITLYICVAIVQPLSHVWLFEAPWTAACQASLTLTVSWSLPKFMSIALVIPSSHLILWLPLLLLPSVFPSKRAFSIELAVLIRWPKYWSFSFSISPSNEYLGLISLKTGWISLQSKGLSVVFSNTAVQRHQFFSLLPSLQSNSHNHMWPLGRPWPWLYGPLSAE